MTLEVTLDIEATRFLWPSSPSAVVRVTNVGDEPVETRHEGRGVAFLRATDVEAMWPAGKAPPPPVPGTSTPVTVAPGATVEERFELADRLKLPGAGMFALRAHVEWQDGKAASMPVRVEVVPSQPRAVCLGTTTGGTNGHVYAVWVHASGDRGTLLLTLLSAVGEACFLATKHVADVPSGAVPALSAPACRAPFAQWLAWVDGATLGYAIHQVGRMDVRALDLERPGFQLVSPILEVPPQPGALRYAEALLLRDTQSGWEMRVARLGAGDVVSDAAQVDTPPPAWARAAHRPDGTRCAVFIVPRSQGDLRQVQVLVAPWAPEAPPGPPLVAARWPGVLLAADQRTDASGIVVGAALLDVGVEHPRYALQRWRIDRDDCLEEGAFSRVEWPWRTPVERALVRVDPFGVPYAVLKGGPESSSFSCRGKEVVPLPEALAPPAEPLDVYFVDQDVPALVFDDPRSGLSLYSTGPRRVLISPAGIAV